MAKYQKLPVNANPVKAITNNNNITTISQDPPDLGRGKTLGSCAF